MAKNFMYAVSFLAAGALASVFASCDDEAAVAAAISNILGISAEAPLYLGYTVVSGKQIDFGFSADVSVKYARMEPEVPLEGVKNGSCVSVFLEREYPCGGKVTADILVEDKEGNTLNVLVPFRAFNGRIPEFVINEIRLNYLKPRSEFIELKMLSAGNLGAVRLFIVSVDFEESVYEFPPVEVEAGEYVILHLRTLDPEHEVDELDGRLDLASTTETADAPADARDLWVSVSTKMIHKTDVVYFTGQTGDIIDGIVLCEDSQSWDKNENFQKGADLLAEQGHWFPKDGDAAESPSADDAVSSKGTTATRTLCRDETVADSNTSNDWYVCATSNATPGKKNSTKRY